MAAPSPPLRRPGGARPNPSRMISPPKLDIPAGNVPGMNVDQANENGWQIPASSLPSVPIPSKQSPPIQQPKPVPISLSPCDSLPIPATKPSIPSLALNPMARSASGASSRPKLSLSGFSTPVPGSSPGLPPVYSSPLSTSSIYGSEPGSAISSHSAPAPRGRPALLNAPGANLVPSRSGTPSLKLAIPGLGGGSGSASASSSAASGTALNLSGLGGGGSGYSSNYDYPTDPPDDDALDSALRTPTIGAFGFEDRNPTLRPYGQDYDGEEESSYGYGRLGNGLPGLQGGGDAMSSMTEDIRQALSRSRFDTSSSLNSAHSASSSQMRTRDSSGTSSRSSSRQGHRSSGEYADTGLPNMEALSLGRTDSNGQAAVQRRDYGYGSGQSSGRATPTIPSSGSIENVAGGAVVDIGEVVEVTAGPGFIPIVDPSRLIVLRRLGEGSGGAVEMVKDPATGQIMAKKVIARTANPAMHRQLLRELEILNSCASPYIVDHYGSFLAEHDTQIGILMEYCEGGSLDGILQKMKKTGMRCSEHVLGRIAASVLRGLDYLHERRIIHRDIKPSNILITKSGQCKLCDFGVSGELVDSIAGTFTGTSYYMAPERIQGKPYSIRADVWSLGLSLHEVAHLRFPFPPEGENEYVAPIELLSYIVTAPVPEMVDDPSIGRVWSEGIRDFMRLCGTERPYPRELLQHPFIVTSETKKVNMAKWISALLDAA